MDENRYQLEVPPEMAGIELGPCCACQQQEATVVLLLPWKSGEPGKGWGCVTCGLPPDGAMAVVCEGCAEAGVEPLYAATGYLEDQGRMPLRELTEPHLHDVRRHPEAPSVN